MANVERLWGAIDYKANLRFFDGMYKVAHTLAKDFDHWWTDRLTVVVHDFDDRRSIALSSKRATFEALNPNDPVITFKDLASKLRYCIETLEYRSITRMGLKFAAYLDLGLTFEELRDQLRPICLPSAEQLQKIAADSEARDFQLRFEYIWEGYNAAIRIAPMTKDQILLDLRNIGSVDKLLQPPEKGEDAAAFFAGIKDTLLGFDLDVYAEGERSLSEWTSFSDVVPPYLLKMRDRVKNVVLEKQS